MEKYIDNEELIAVGESLVGRVRSANEDFCGYQSTPNGELFVVCDGMGGHVGGAEASKTAVSYIIKTLAETKYEDIPLALKKALTDANAAVYEKGRQNPSLSGMGTTACVLMVWDGKAWISHVGDSRIYLFTARDKVLHRITKDHSYVQSLVDMGQLDDRDAETHPRKNVILKALGIKENLSVETVQMPVLPSDGDMFLICSDGLSGMVDDDRIECILADNDVIEVALQTLMDEANAPGRGTDNITAQLIRIKGVNREFSEFVDYNPSWRQNRYTAMSTLDFNLQSAQPVKRKKSRWWLWTLLSIVGALFIGAAAYVAYLNLKDMTGAKAIERQIEALQNDINNLNEVIKQNDKEIKDLEKEEQNTFEKTKAHNEARQAEIRGLKDVSKELQDSLGRVTDRFNEAKSKLEAMKKEQPTKQIKI